MQATIPTETVQTNPEDPLPLIQTQVIAPTQPNEQKLSPEEQKQLEKVLQQEAIQVAGILMALQNLSSDESKTEKVLWMILKFILSISVTLTFGVLFYVFQDQSQYNDDCSQYVFKKWAYACSLMSFIQCGLSATKMIGEYYIFRDIPQFIQQLIRLNFILYALNAIGLFACAIGLTVNDSDECGSLHKLAMAYYIITYIGSGIAALIIFCSCLCA